GRLAMRDLGEQVLAHFVFDGADRIAGGAEFSEGVDGGHVVGSGSGSGSRLNWFMARFRSPRAKRTRASTARSTLLCTVGSSSSWKSSRTYSLKRTSG